MTLLYTQSTDQRYQKIVEEYRARVLGDTCLRHAPSEYWEIGLACEMGIPIGEWWEIPLDERAQIMGRHYLENMVKTIDAHNREMKENLKKNQEESIAKSKNLNPYSPG